MSNWTISDEAKGTMEFLGNFGPTTNAKDRKIKGTMDDGEGESSSVYLSSDELREMAAHFIEVAGWLDAQA
jgi:hypothetical protein